MFTLKGLTTHRPEDVEPFQGTSARLPTQGYGIKPLWGKFHVNPPNLELLSTIKMT